MRRPVVVTSKPGGSGLRTGGSGSPARRRSAAAAQAAQAAQAAAMAAVAAPAGSAPAASSHYDCELYFDEQDSTARVVLRDSERGRKWKWLGKGGKADLSKVKLKMMRDIDAMNGEKQQQEEEEEKKEQERRRAVKEKAKQEEKKKQQAALLAGPPKGQKKESANAKKARERKERRHALREQARM